MYEYNHNFEQDQGGHTPVETAYRIENEPPRKKRTGLRIVALCLCCALLGGAAGVGGAALYNRSTDPRGSTTLYETDRPTAAVTVANLPAGRELTASELYAANVGSCVGISVSTTANYFGYTTTSATSGSGFVISQDGYIVTNYHVIEQAAKDASVPITVSLQNGESYDAKLVGGEKDNDVAVLKIEASGLTPVVLGDSDKLVVGEPVYAIGNPLGELTFTLTDGLVSALDRLITTGSGNDATSLNVLQTNCAINSGNSGGPLFNGYGELVGITTAKMSNNSSSSASVEGLCFAIPINDVKNIIQDLIEHGYVTGKPYMGISAYSVSESESQRYNLPMGALVDTVESGSCAEKAGLQKGDIITAINDTEISSSPALVAAKAAYRAGDTVTLTVYRSGQLIQLQLTFDEQPRQEPAVIPTDSGSQTQIIPGNGSGSGNGGYYFQWPFGNIFG